MHLCIYPHYTYLGGIVTSTAKRLNHPCTLTGETGPGYLFFGIVVSSFPETVDATWTNVELGYESKDVVKPNKGKGRDQTSLIICVDRHIGCIIMKK